MFHRKCGGVQPGTQNGRQLSRCAIEPAESGVVRKPPRRKKITTQVWRRVTTCHTRTPLTLNRPRLASLQLCSPLVFGFPLVLRPLSLDSPVLSLVSQSHRSEQTRCRHLGPPHASEQTRIRHSPRTASLWLKFRDLNEPSLLFTAIVQMDVY
jgi:hypothetical protein